MGLLRDRASKLAWTMVAGAMLAACAAPRRGPAPVEDRGTAPRMTVAPAPGAAATPPRALPGAENAGQPGYHTVRPGDTLARIGLEAGQSFRDIARWNNLDNPNVIEVGQVLRVTPPGTAVTATPGSPAQSAPAIAANAPRPLASASPTAPTGQAASPVEDEINWSWPTAAGTTVIAGFDEQKNKGLDIAGRPGDPVLASADGRVVYAGAGLRGYGNLIILKHNNTFLTAYAHNQSLLVKEDQTVRKGQKIAEMGSTDADRVKLHFEIRRQGKPVDPSRYLPSR